MGSSKSINTSQELQLYYYYGVRGGAGAGAVVIYIAVSLHPYHVSRAPFAPLLL